MARPRFTPLTVKRVVRETADALAIEFDVPPEMADAFRFRPGQYLTLMGEIDGEKLRRNYSICAGVNDGRLRVGVKRVEGGRFSSWANANLAPGHVVQVMPPNGTFCTDLDPTRARNALFIAAGSGITPILSLVKSILEVEPQSRVTLIYGNRRTQTIMFREELADLKDRWRDRFTLIHVLSREPQEVALFHGRLDRERLEALFALVDARAMEEAWLCGPEEMVRSAIAALEALGLPPARIHAELFGTAAAARPQGAQGADGAVAPGTVTVAEADALAGQVAEVTVVLDGTATVLTLPFIGPSLLDAAQAAGADVPFSCKGGMCCTCKAKVLEGDVVMDLNYALEPDEVAAGYILTCQSHPRSSRLVVSYD